MGKEKTIKLKLRAGRKIKLTEALLKDIKKCLKEGIFEKYVYQALQIPERTWFSWKDQALKIEEAIGKGAKTKSKSEAKKWTIFLQFLQAVRETRPRVIIDMVDLLQQMAKTDYRALRMFLQTVAKEEFGEVDTLNLNIDGKMNVTMEQLLKDEGNYKDGNRPRAKTKTKYPKT